MSEQNLKWLPYQVDKAPPLVQWFEEGRIDSSLLDVARSVPVKLGDTIRPLLEETFQAGGPKQVDFAQGAYQPNQVFVDRILSAGLNTARFVWKLDDGKLTATASTQLQEFRNICAAFASIGLTLSGTEPLPSDFRVCRNFIGREEAVRASVLGVANFAQAQQIRSERTNKPADLAQFRQLAEVPQLQMGLQHEMSAVHSGRVIVSWCLPS